MRTGTFGSCCPATSPPETAGVDGAVPVVESSATFGSPHAVPHFVPIPSRLPARSHRGPSDGDFPGIRAPRTRYMFREKGIDLAIHETVFCSADRPTGRGGRRPRRGSGGGGGRAPPPPPGRAPAPPPIPYPASAAAMNVPWLPTTSGPHAPSDHRLSAVTALDDSCRRLSPPGRAMPGCAQLRAYQRA